MQPTHEKMAAVMRDHTLMSGFDDPEVMTAVQDIAAHPGAMQKYTHNPKVSSSRKLTQCTLRGTVLSKNATPPPQLIS